MFAGTAGRPMSPTPGGSGPRRRGAASMRDLTIHQDDEEELRTPEKVGVRRVSRNKS